MASSLSLCLTKQGQPDDVTLLHSPSRADTPTTPKSRCLREQPPVWSTMELLHAVQLLFLGTPSVSPAINVKCEFGFKQLIIWCGHCDIYLSVRSSQDHVFSRSMKHKRSLHSYFHGRKRGIILCEDKNSSLDETQYVKRWDFSNMMRHWWNTECFTSRKVEVHRRDLSFTVVSSSPCRGHLSTTHLSPFSHD